MGRRLVGVILALLVAGATPPSVFAADNVTSVCFKTNSTQPVTQWDWAKAIWGMTFASGYAIDNAYLTGADNQVVTWIIAVKKYPIPGKSFYIGKTTSVVVGVVDRNGRLTFNGVVDNAALSTPRTKFLVNGWISPPAGFLQRLPRRQ